MKRPRDFAKPSSRRPCDWIDAHRESSRDHMRIHFHEKPWRLHCLFVLLLFVGAGAAAAGPTSRALLFTFSGKDTVGVITDVEWRRINPRRSIPFHHFTYRTETGEDRNGATRYPSIFVTAQKGDPVPVCYRNTDAEITSLNHLWGAPALALILAGVLLRLIIKWCRKNVNITIRPAT